MTSDHALRDVARVRRGPIVKSRNGRTVHEWAVVVLTCGHHVLYARLKDPTRWPPRRVRCPECRS